jgi:hypothetical protein
MFIQMKANNFSQRSGCLHEFHIRPMCAASGHTSVDERPQEGGIEGRENQEKAKGDLVPPIRCKELVGHQTVKQSGIYLSGPQECGSAPREVPVQFYVQSVTHI